MQKGTEMAHPDILHFIGLFHEIFWQHYKQFYIMRSRLRYSCKFVEQLHACHSIHRRLFFIVVVAFSDLPSFK